MSGFPYSIELESIYTSSCTSLSMISRSKKIHFNLSQPTLGYLEVKGSTFQLHLSNFPWNIFKISNLETSHMMKFTRKTKKLLHFHVKFKTQDREISVNSRIIFKFHHPSVKKNAKKICNPLTFGHPTRFVTILDPKVHEHKTPPPNGYGVCPDPNGRPLGEAWISQELHMEGLTHQRFGIWKQPLSPQSTLLGGCWSQR